MIELRSYQQAAADRIENLMRKYRCAYLSGEVRTGKTLTAFEVIRRLDCQPVLFVTKKKAIASIVPEVPHKQKDHYFLFS